MSVRGNVEIAPPGMGAPAAAYAHAVLTVGPSRWLHTAGVVASRADGSVAADLAGQLETVWANIGDILAAAEMAIRDIVSYTSYVVAGEDLSAVMAARDRFMGGHRAASTLVTVPMLARPAWKVEIAVIAATPEP